MLQFRSPFRSWRAIGLIAVLILGICFCPAVLAQDQDYQPLGPDDLQQMVAPIALYPDAILAQVLVAATYPDDVIAADQWLAAGNNPAGIDDQGWDLSVKGVARFPDVLHYMASNSDWMDDLGDAFLNQQSDVMDAVQALRSQALADGSLVSNDQQQVVVMGSTIEIIPTDPNTIYLPIYDPATVYEEPDYEPGTVIEPRIRFGPPVHCGPWLHHDVDWHDRAVYVGDWGVDRPWWKHNPHGGPQDYTHDRPGIFHQSDHITINVHNTKVNYPAGRWNRSDHDPKKALPKVIAHPGGHLPDVKSGKYPARVDLHPAKKNEPVKEVSGPLNYGSGPEAARASERGKDSRAVEHNQGQNNHPEAKPVETKAPEAKSEEKKPEEKKPAETKAPVEAKPAEQKPAEQKPTEQKPTEPARHALPKEESHTAAKAPTPAPKESKPAPQPVEHSSGVMSGYDRGSQAGADSQRGAQSRGSGGGSHGGGGGSSPPPSRSPSPPPSRSPSPPPSQRRGK